MWNEEIFTAEKIVNLYSREIEELARNEREEVNRKYMPVIDALCGSQDIEYDWKNSPEEFEDWLKRMHIIYPLKITEKVYYCIADVWQKIQDADNKWKSVYYGLEDISLSRYAVRRKQNRKRNNQSGSRTMARFDEKHGEECPHGASTQCSCPFCGMNLRGI